MARPESPGLIRERKQKQSRRRRLLRIYFWLFFYASIFIALVLFSNWDFLLVSKLTVKGQQVASTEAIVSATNQVLQGNHFYLFSKRHALFLPRQMIKDSIVEDVPLVAEVDLAIEKIQKVNYLQITVSERRPVALWCQVKQCYFIDRTGFVFASAPSFSDNILLKIYGPGAVQPIKTYPLLETDFKLLIEAAEIIPTILAEAGLLKAEVSQAIVTTERDYEFRITQNIETGRGEWRLLFDSRDDFSHLLSNLQAALATDEFKEDYLKKNGQLQYIDLRFGNKVFYKFL